MRRNSDSPIVSSMQQSSSILNRLLQIAVLVYQAVAVGAVIFSLFLANAWLKLPFMGAIFEPTMVWNGSEPMQSPNAWSLHQLGPQIGHQVGDRLIAVNGVPVFNAQDVRKALTGELPGIVLTDKGFVAADHPTDHPYGQRRRKNSCYYPAQFPGR